MSIKKRLAQERFFKLLMVIATSMIVGILALILGSIVYRGLPFLSWEMISQTPKGGYYLGKEGGILNAIIGSLYLAFGATLLAFAIGFPIALYINTYLRKNSWRGNLIRLCFDILWGIPSIVYGAFGFMLMVFLGMKTSLFAGIVVVSLVILPVIVRTIDEIINMIPRGLYEASYSLGATKFETSVKVVFRQVLPGIITATLMAFGRAIGDAAAVLFTTGYTDFIPTSLLHAAATLPLAIFFQLGTAIPEVQGRAYASALILTILILIISVAIRLITKKYNKFRI